jgi:exonuclease 3'-5' domain-containing protein 1
VWDEDGLPVQRKNWPIPVDFTTEYVKPPHRIISADSEHAIRGMLRDILSPARDDPRIIVDLEGNNLGAKGDISLLVVHVEHFNKTYLVDMLTLGKSAFTFFIDHFRCTGHEDTHGVAETVSLKSVLESEEWPKLLWDCRTDSNALYFLYGVDLKGVEDVQLYENLQFTYYWDSCYPEKNYLLGLAKAIDRYAKTPQSVKADLVMLKTSFNGRYHLFGMRPLSDEAIKYATNDVQHLGPMLDTFAKKLNSQERYMVKIETKNRLDFSRREDFAGSGYAPDWSSYRGAPDLAWLVQLGWTGEEAVCNGGCLSAWGHPHVCKKTCACYGTCEDWRRKVEEGIRNAERRTFGKDYVGGDMHQAQWNEVRKAEGERDQGLKMRCDSCTASKGAKNARGHAGNEYLPVMDFEKEITGK